MWIYFVEQVWCYNPDEWPRLGWTTKESQARFWDNWHDNGYKTMTVYPQKHMVHGEDYIEF